MGSECRGHDGSGPNRRPGDDDEYSDDKSEESWDLGGRNPGNGSEGRGNNSKISTLQLNGVQVKQGTYAAMERNASYPQAKGRLVPRPFVIEVRVNDQWCRALVDSGSLGGFISTTLADQL